MAAARRRKRKQLLRERREEKVLASLRSFSVCFRHEADETASCGDRGQGLKMVTPPP